MVAADNQLGGQTLIPGVYSFGTAATANLIGTLTLDAQGDPDAVFIFQASADLVTASNSVVQMINGGQACNVFWQVTSSATLGTTTTFVGSILALTSIADNGSSNVNGRLLARNGAVTLSSTTIIVPGCAVSGTGTGGSTGGSLAGTSGTGSMNNSLGFMLAFTVASVYAAPLAYSAVRKFKSNRT